MLRLTVLALLLANALYFFWANGLLRAWGFAPVPQSEPHRLAQQIRPEALRVLGVDEARRAEAAASLSALASSAPRVAECLQSGPFDDAQASTLKRTLAGALPSGGWVLDEAVGPGRWIIYMGKYPNGDALDRKKAELRQMGIAFEPVGSATLEPGLSLGAFPSQAAASQQMGELAQRGVRTAKVVQEKSEARIFTLRLPAVDETLRGRLDEVRAALGQRTLVACR